ncbi:MAG TPA: Fur family transcriptional regulator [Solirubrobacteraceae bacterium]|jgi:Fur family ferric uptake transcriptional regulator|nr:Fur family transcriptional regulator [Solirubrobacteraceae bacterium]
MPGSHPPTDTDIDDAKRLRNAGLRVTSARLAVLAAVRERPHATVDEIADSARGRSGAVSIQAVYDVLRALAKAGLARRIEPAGSAARFEARVGDNHHHLVCRSCGAVADVDCAVGHAPCLTPDDASGFLVDEADVTYWGICPACQSTHAEPGEAA